LLTAFFVVKKTDTVAKVNSSDDDLRLLDEVNQHYSMSSDDLDTRKPDWDKKDELFNCWLSEDKSKWPYESLVFDPRIWTFIIDKSSRLIAGKPKGRLVPRENGDELGAMINNSLLDFYWDDVSRVGNESMISRWIRMDQTCRRRGASFAFVPWHYEKQNGKEFYSGPNFIPWNSRDVLADPSYPFIRNWIQLRKYTTLQELESINEAASTGPIYRNLDKLRDKLKEDAKGDLRSTNSISRELSLKGLGDVLGKDEKYKVVEVITEYRRDRWITFAPKHGVVLRDIDNPYDHGQIPVVQLKYYAKDDDIYGFSEIEPIERLQNATNALICQYLDAVNTDLYPPILIDPTKMRMHTVEFGSNKKWIGSPGPGGWDSAVHRMETSTAATAKFTSTYQFLISAMMNAMGESSLGVSNLQGGMNPNKTATEVNAVEQGKSSRDNFNLIFLNEALKQQMMFWHMLTKQFVFGDKKEEKKAIRIVGSEALAYFNQQGLGDIHPTDEETQQAAANNQAYPPELVGMPVFPVGKDLKTPKLSMDTSGKSGELLVEPSDLSGTYDYIPDIESWKQPSQQEQEQKSMAMLTTLTAPGITQGLAAEGKRLKVSEIVIKFLESAKVTQDAESLLEDIPQGQPTGAGMPPGMPGGNQNGSIAGGAGSPQQGVAGQVMAGA
jgi:hypothetical protein